MNTENKYQESIFERIMPVLDDYQLAKLKIQQLRAKGSTDHRGKVKQVRRANIKAQEIKYLLGE